MSGTIRFYLDENVSSAIADGLRRRGIEVSTTPEEGLIASSDEAQLAFALSQGRVIFTQDDDFLWLNQAGFTHAGIVYCRQNKPFQLPDVLLPSACRRSISSFGNKKLSSMGAYSTWGMVAHEAVLP